MNMLNNKYLTVINLQLFHDLLCEIDLKPGYILSFVSKAAFYHNQNLNFQFKSYFKIKMNHVLLRG